MPMMSVSAYASTRDVLDSTIHNGIKDGAIPAERSPAGWQVDAELLDRTWLAAHRARKAAVQAGAESRQRSLNAAVVALTSEIQTLNRQARELRRITAPRAAAQPAQDRRMARLQAALAAMPALHTAPAARALQQPPTAVYAALLKFSRRLEADTAPASMRLAAE